MGWRPTTDRPRAEPSEGRVAIVRRGIYTDLLDPESARKLALDLQAAAERVDPRPADRTARAPKRRGEGLMHRLRLGEDDVREIDYPIGSVVYLRCRDERVRGLVTGYYVRAGDLAYIVAWGSDGHELHHYGFELSSSYAPDFDAGASDGSATVGG